MGISRSAVKLLIQEAQRRPLQGKILTLGKQDVILDEKKLNHIAKELHFELFPCSVADHLSHKPEYRKQGFLSDKYLLSRLGFSEICSLDFSDYEKADCIFDLNQSQLLPNLIDSFDFILDGGTLEHVFHFPNALKNMIEMVRVGGRIFHQSPSHNHMDHGFYMFSPTVFWDFYNANHFDFNRFQILRNNPAKDFPIKVYSYEPGCINKVSFGGLDSARYEIHCIVTKTSQSLANAIPQQFVYQKEAWINNRELIPIPSKFSSIKKKIKNIRFLYKILSPFNSLLCLIQRKSFKFRGIKLKTYTRL